jgi:hypothetical protein
LELTLYYGVSMARPELSLGCCTVTGEFDT